MDETLFEKMLSKVQKPGRYCGGEINSVVKDRSKVSVRLAFCFPDTYEIGMSHLGIKILYSVFNEREDVWCERVFAPLDDMDFDFIGFTLQYELSYTNVLYMLDLAGVPLRTADRGEDAPIVVAGGPCACNAEPLADFIDIFFLGEGEKVDLEVIDLYKECKKAGKSKKEFFAEAAKIEGVYVPSRYEVEYNADGTLKSLLPVSDGVPGKIRKRVETDLDAAYYPERFESA